MTEYVANNRLVANLAVHLISRNHDFTVRSIDGENKAVECSEEAMREYERTLEAAPLEKLSGSHLIVGTSGGRLSLLTRRSVPLDKALKYVNAFPPDKCAMILACPRPFTIGKTD